MLVEGEEEVGSRNLMQFFERHKQKLKSDVIVVCDTENIDVGLPSITYSLRGIVAVQVEVESATLPVHSGMAGGALADAAIALNVILAGSTGTTASCRSPASTTRSARSRTRSGRRMRSLPGDEAKMRQDMGMLPGVKLACETGQVGLRADLAEAGRDGDRPGGQLDQGGVQPGAAEGVGHRQSAGSCRTRTRSKCSSS